MPAAYPLSGAHEEFIRSARVGHLASASAQGLPHVMPVCFELIEGRIYIGLDSKPKSVDASRLRRVRNITENPSVSFLVDRYDEDWSRLGYVLVRATATMCESEHERGCVVRALRSKYPQYQTMLPDDPPVIRVTPVSVSSWGDLTPQDTRR